MNGILVVNKPKNLTSRDVVNIICKKFNTKKVGHTGTLDPIATGVLVVPIGKALKVSELLTSERKEYIARVILGYETDMLDITGTITNKNIPDVNIDKLKEELSSFIGTYSQKVPMYSAVKVGGKKLYEYARNNIKVEAPSKDVTIYSLELIDTPIKINDTIEFSIKCTVSKGTYIRSLIRDIAYKLGTYGTMKELVRTKQGNFSIENAYSLEDIQNNNYKLLSIRDSLPNIKVTKIDDNILKKVKNGMVLHSFFNEEISLLVDKDDNEIAIYKQDGKGNVKPYKMIEV